MEAILLAAGQGRRFGGALEYGCKVLIEVHGECLLDRHLDALLAHGVDHVTVVVGYEAQRIEQRLAAVAKGRAVATLRNPNWRTGSLESLWCARGLLDAGACLVMDADVLYDGAMIGALVADPHPDALLFDGGFMDEEMKVGLRGGHAVMLGKKIAADDYEGMGRGPGFYKVGAAAGGEFSQVLAAMMAEGLGTMEYEDAFNRLFARRPFWPVPVGARAWTEIDHAADLARARDEIWPRLPHP